MLFLARLHQVTSTTKAIRADDLDRKPHKIGVVRAPSLRGGKKGFVAYVEVLLTGRSGDAKYTLGVTAAKR